jgi:hypothetical protein
MIHQCQFIQVHVNTGLTKIIVPYTLIVLLLEGFVFGVSFFNPEFIPRAVRVEFVHGRGTLLKVSF